MILEKKKNFIKINNLYINLKNIFEIEIDDEEHQIIFIFNKQEDFKRITVDYQKEQGFLIRKSINNWLLSHENIIEKIKKFIETRLKHD